MLFAQDDLHPCVAFLPCPPSGSASPTPFLPASPCHNWRSSAEASPRPRPAAAGGRQPARCRSVLRHELGAEPHRTRAPLPAPDHPVLGVLADLRISGPRGSDPHRPSHPWPFAATARGTARVRSQHRGQMGARPTRAHGRLAQTHPGVPGIGPKRITHGPKRDCRG